jgi:1-phosphatidylinositol-4-phosphate 5-kinase
VEAKFFRSILPQYYRHMESCRNTVLCRFFGLHRLKHASWNKLYLLIMSNIFDTDRVIHCRYDLKGSKVHLP